MTPFFHQKGLAMIIDSHIHTRHSVDSDCTMIDYCQSAIDKGLQAICITDHWDTNPLDDGCGKYKPEEYFDELEKAREFCGSRLRLLSGVEFGEPHIYTTDFDKCQSYPYDFIIGSVHYWGNGLPFSSLVRGEVPLDEVYAGYWQEVRKMAEYGGFDSLGHINFPARYCEQNMWDKEQLAAIYKIMLDNYIALEINTSSLRRGLGFTVPNEEMLELYAEVGGKYVTIGSDAHKAEHVGSGIDVAAGYAERFGFTVLPLINK